MGYTSQCSRLWIGYQRGLLSGRSYWNHSRKTSYPDVPTSKPLLLAADTRRVYPVVYVPILNISKSQSVVFQPHLWGFPSPLQLYTSDRRVIVQASYFWSFSQKELIDDQIVTHHGPESHRTNKNPNHLSKSPSILPWGKAANLNSFVELANNVEFQNCRLAEDKRTPIVSIDSSKRGVKFPLSSRLGHGIHWYN